jgi:hypothetical protein
MMILYICIVFILGGVSSSHAAILANGTTPQWTFNSGEADTVYSLTQGNHPYIIDFLTEYGVAAWPPSHATKYRYWGTFTTTGACWIEGQEMRESAFLMVSDDGQTWVAPPGANGYGDLEISTDADCPSPNRADSFLIYDPYNGGGDGRVIVGYSKENQYHYYAYRVVSADWSVSAETVVNGGYKTCLAPSVVIESDNLWHMWYLQSHQTHPTEHAEGYDTPQIWHTTSANQGGTWATPQICSVDVMQTAYGSTGQKHPWHMEARLNQFMPGVVELAISLASDTNLTLTDGMPTNGWIGMPLAHARTTLARPMLITTPLAPEMLVEPTEDYNDWDGDFIYKASGIPYVSANQLGLKLWYQGNTWENTYPFEEISESYIMYTSGLIGLPLIISQDLSDNLLTIYDLSGGILTWMPFSQ